MFHAYYRDKIYPNSQATMITLNKPKEGQKDKNPTKRLIDSWKIKSHKSPQKDQALKGSILI